MVNDIENALFTEIATLLRATYKGISVYGEEVEVPASFPSVTLVESDNSTYRPSMTLDGSGHHANRLYTANAYSNLQSGGKQQCKDIMKTVADWMADHGFVKTTDTPLPNYERSISRRVARFTGVQDEQNLIYRI